MMNIGLRIKKVRAELKLSSGKFASELDIPVRTVGSYERNEAQPGAKFFKVLLEHYNVNINWLLTGKGNIFVSANADNNANDNSCSKLNLSEEELAELTRLLNNEAGKDMIVKLIEIRGGNIEAVDELIFNLRGIKAMYS